MRPLIYIWKYRSIAKTPNCSKAGTGYKYESQKNHSVWKSRARHQSDWHLHVRHVRIMAAVSDLRSCLLYAIETSSFVRCPEAVPPTLRTIFLLSHRSSSSLRQWLQAFQLIPPTPYFGSSNIVIMNGTRRLYLSATLALMSLGCLVLGQLVVKNDLDSVLARYENVSTYYTFLKVSLDGLSRD